MSKAFIAIFSFLFANLILAQENDNSKYIKTHNESEVLIEEGWQNEGLKVNYWYFYYPDGSIKSKGSFINGEKEGYWYYYSENGLKQYEGHYLKDKKEKWWITFDEEEEPLFKCQYKNDVKQGYSLCYMKGKLIRSEKYENNKKVDEWTSFWKFKQSNNLDDLK